MRHLPSILIAGLALAAGPATAQLLPGVGAALGDAVRPLQRPLEPIGEGIAGVTATARNLAALRTSRLAQLVRDHRGLIETDAAGQPARRGELLVVGATSEDLARAERAGFHPLTTEPLGELDLTVTRLGVPPGSSLAKAQRQLERLLPGATISADHLHFVSGNPAVGALPPKPASAGTIIDTPVGMIDGAPGDGIPVATVRGFARGAPLASDHGSAVASLLARAGVRRIAVADVYGADPAGGNALAIVQGIDWLLRTGARVISISLVGPNNPVLERAIAAARRKGVTFVAAVGNDGPAAPPSYPASYSGVLAVTGVDGRNRVLIEAGRALHLDYAAPAADMAAANRSGKWGKVRGTSFAVPLVAARAAAALKDATDSVPPLDREAVDLGAKGPDRVFGRGLLCGSCRSAG